MPYGKAFVVFLFMKYMNLGYNWGSYL